MINFYLLHSTPDQLNLYSDLGNVIDEDGDLSWTDADGQLHRDGDKPAFVIGQGMSLPAGYSRSWYQHGKLHRDGNKPARIIRSPGRMWLNWWLNGKETSTITIHIKKADISGTLGYINCSYKSDGTSVVRIGVVGSTGHMTTVRLQHPIPDELAVISELIAKYR